MNCDLRFSSLVIPHLPGSIPEKAKTAFVEAIQQKQVGFQGRFWRKKEKDQSDKWVVPFFSGAVIREENIFRLVIRDSGPVWVPTANKTLKLGIEIAVIKCGASWSEAVVTPIVFKKEIHPESHDVDFVEEIIESHQRYYTDLDEGVSSPPIFVGIRAKKGVKIVDHYQKKSLDHLQHSLIGENLVREKTFTLITLAEGLSNVSKTLIALKKDKKAHLDVKHTNIFVDFVNSRYTLGLADFEFMDPLEKDFRELNQEKYVFWDYVRNKIRIVTSFCDVYGFAHSLASVLWGYHEGDSEEAFTGFMKQNQDPKLFRVHAFALSFVMKVKNEDLRRASLLKDRSETISSDEDKQAILNILKEDRITPEDCLEFTNHWLEEMHAAGLS